ncbi:MAG TPA: HPr kinase/phosphorylase, partial [Candidatus Eisenbacteria bacterium]|nr:HPr kinase/phosphorylase [Candidatus Eisenbacteria bacterium]
MSSTSPPTLTVAQLYEQQKDQLSLEHLSESLESKVPITMSDINRPGMALMGFTENFLAERIQIFGRTELAYLGTLKDKERRAALDRFFQFQAPCIIVAKGLEIPSELVGRANDHEIPVFRTPQDTTP